MTDDCNYMVVMEGSGGLVNNLLSLVFAFAIDRMVLVESGNHFKDLALALLNVEAGNWR